MTIDREQVKKHAFTLFATALLSVILICSFLIATAFLGDSNKARLLLMTMTIAGAAGGIVNYFYSNMITNMVAPKDLIPCVVVGIGASLLLPFLFSLTSSTLLQTATDNPQTADAVVNYLTIISWSLLAGISGEPLISLMTSRFIRTIGENDGGEAVSLTITSSKLDDGTIGAKYSQKLEAKNGKGQLTWSVVPPLPAGLTLDKTSGKISGIPTVIVEKMLNFTVSDSSKPDPQSDTHEIKLTITA